MQYTRVVWQIRGPYKRYLTDPECKIPKQTQTRFNWKQRSLHLVKVKKLHDNNLSKYFLKASEDVLHIASHAGHRWRLWEGEFPHQLHSCWPAFGLNPL